MRLARAVVWEGLRSSQAYQVGTLCNVNMEYLREIGNIHRHAGLGRKVDLVSKNLENIGTFHNDFVSASFYVYLPLLSKYLASCHLYTWLFRLFLCGKIND